MTAFLAQGISLLMSVFMSFVVPKFLGVTAYSYWQLFIFYIGYVGIFHFGYNDGIYLRLGGKHYEDLDYEQLGTQFKVFALVEIVVALLIAVSGNFLVNEIERGYVWLFAAIYLVFNNLHLFYGYIFQAVNKTKIYSRSVILDRLCVLIFIVFFIINKEESFLPYIITYTISKCIAFVYLCCYGRKIVFSKIIHINAALNDMWVSLLCGIKLTVANIMSMLVLGVGRMLIDIVWGIETFGEISLALSLTNFFLVFIQQVSMVLFPVLRRTSESQLKAIYNKMRIALGLFLPIVFLCYYPLKVIIGFWLPQYSVSLKYLVLLLPLCTFDGKMQMLCNTYLKVLRQEKKLLQFNIISFVVSLVLCSISAYIFRSMTFVVVAMSFSVALRSVLTELYLSTLMEISIAKILVQEIFIAVIFMGTAWCIEDRIAFILIVCSYFVYIFINRRSVNFKYLVNIIRRVGKSDK